jgi:membrane-associated phospholipid phosphatase
VSAIGSALLARFGIVEPIYRFYKRPRPHDALSLRPIFRQNIPSFPSGHAAFFFAFGTVILYFAPTYGVLILIGAGVMCVGRVVGGLHYPSDILGGALVGITAAMLGMGMVLFVGLL